MSSIGLKVGSVILASGAGSKDRMFGLDMQLLLQSALVMISVLILFALLGYLLFNPVKDVLAKRKERIKSEITQAADIKKEAEGLKSDYESKLSEIDKQAEEILTTARKKALTREREIIGEAQEEAERIINRARLEIEREKEQIKDDMRKEMIEVATIMASKFVVNSIDNKKKEALIEETLSNMDESIWLN